MPAKWPHSSSRTPKILELRRQLKEGIMARRRQVFQVHPRIMLAHCQAGLVVRAALDADMVDWAEGDGDGTREGAEAGSGMESGAVVRVRRCRVTPPSEGVGGDLHLVSLSARNGPGVTYCHCVATTSACQVQTAQTGACWLQHFLAW